MLCLVYPHRNFVIAIWLLVVLPFFYTSSLLSAVEPAPSFFRGINLNGPAVSIDGNLWEGKESQNYSSKDKAFENQDVLLTIATDAERAKMIRSSRWGGNRVTLRNIPRGSYTVFLYVWEDNQSERFSVYVNGKEVEHDYQSGSAGDWKRLGPWPIILKNNQAIEITSRGGAANFSGVEIWRGQYDGETKIREEHLAFFENRIRPILVEHCYECHSSESSELQGGLLVDSRPTLRRGGENGPAVVPGDIDHSLLIRAVRYDDGIEMPPDEKLSDREIADLEQWVRIGAPDPRGDPTRFDRKKIDIEKDRLFWSLRPIYDPLPPTVKDSSWPITELDRFILAELEKRHLKPVEDTDRATWIRRATYDLTGLAPTTAELRTFLEDKSELAYERVVDRLLDSVHYGERWGRHWMDLVRYADTAGDNSDYPIPQAYLYRNYIIDSFNADKPYDQFLKEQIAGDLLPHEDDAQSNEQTIATGYIAISRRFGSVIDRYPYHLTIEDTLDNIGRTVLGMTLTCARCHDHKFDPVSQEDYYGLYGIFESSRYPFPGIELDKRPRDHVPLKENGKPSKTLVYAMAEGKASDSPLQIRGEPKDKGDMIERKFPDVLGGFRLSSEEARQSGRLQLANWLATPKNPLTARVMVNRIWQHHFGAAIVRTPSDFGIRGLPPTHPELLDYLASRFIEDRWSIKKMHRRIMLSRVYRLSSKVTHREDENAADPNNEFYWRFNRQRLDAESLRDILLQLSGELNMEMPREPHPFPPSDKWEYTQHHPFRDSYETNHRSVYLMMARLNTRPFFSTFDGPDRNASTAVRDRSVTTIQSLYLLNDPFIYKQSEKYALRLRKETPDFDTRLRMAFEQTLGRPASEDELRDTKVWFNALKGQLADSKTYGEEMEQEQWSAFIRVLFRINEFLYID